MAGQRRSSLGEFCAVAAAAVTTLMMCGTPARASTLFTSGNALVRPGDVGDSLDVFLTNTGPSAITVGAFSFGISVSAASGVTFTDATVNTVLFSYIFTGSSLFGPDITNPMQTLPGTAITASDLTTLAGVTVGSGSSVGLGHVFFNVGLGAPIGPLTVTVTAFPTSSLSDALGNNINIDTLVNGTITVASTVPEPATVGLVGLGLVAVAMARKRSLRSRRN